MQLLQMVLIDDANALVWPSGRTVDADADGYDNGSATVCYGATTPVGYASTTNGSDCNDSNTAIFMLQYCIM